MKKILYAMMILMCCTCLSIGGNTTNVYAASCTAKKHTGFHWVVTKKATCIASGEKCNVCACGKVRNAPTPTAPLGHNWVKKKGYYQCSRCAAKKK